MESHLGSGLVSLIVMLPQPVGSRRVPIRRARRNSSSVSASAFFSVRLTPRLKMPVAPCVSVRFPSFTSVGWIPCLAAISATV
jgi:hypothetical protein